MIPIDEIDKWFRTKRKRGTTRDKLNVREIESLREIGYAASRDVMKWIEIDVERWPNDEVLCANFKEKTYGYKEKLIGFIELRNDILICENEQERLEGVTHYIKISDFDL